MTSIIKNYDFDKMLIFLQKYESVFSHEYLIAYNKYGPGLLWIDMNKFSNLNYNTKYIPIINKTRFWNHSEDLIYMKNIIIKDKSEKYYLLLMDNDVTTFFERNCFYKINNFIHKPNIENIQNKIKKYIEEKKQKIEQKQKQKKEEEQKQKDIDEEEMMYSIMNY